MKLVAMLRIKNQILTIHDCLGKLSELVDEIVIVDNGSTDGTLYAYKQYPKIVKIEKTKGFDEGRDKCLALELAKARKPDWILWCDGDEVFEEITSRALFDKYMANPKLNLVQFRMFNFWGSKTHYRVDGIWRRYTAFPQRQMWRNLDTAYFQNVPFHNGGILGIPPKHIISHIRIKHYGYIDSKQIKTKNQTYAKMKHDKRAFKTIPTDSSFESVKLVPWKSGYDNSQLNHYFWSFTLLNYRLINFLLPLVKS